MNLFKLLKKQKENINVEEEIAKIKDVKPGVVAPEQSNLKFSLLCINLGVDEYAFTLTANHTGKIIVSKSMSREEYKDLKRSIELYEVIEKNLKSFKKYLYCFIAAVLVLWLINFLLLYSSFLSNSSIKRFNSSKL